MLLVDLNLLYVLLRTLYEAKYSRINQVKFFKGRLPQILIGPFMNTLAHMMVKRSFAQVGCITWCFTNNYCSFVIYQLKLYFQFSAVVIQLDPVCFTSKVCSCFNKAIFIY